MFNFHEGKAKELRDVRNVTLITSSNYVHNYIKFGHGFNSYMI